RAHLAAARFDDRVLERLPRDRSAVAHEVTAAARGVRGGRADDRAHAIVDVDGGEPALAVAEEDVAALLDLAKEVEVVDVARSVHAARPQDGPRNRVAERFDDLLGLELALPVVLDRPARIALAVGPLGGGRPVARERADVDEALHAR